MEIVKLQVSLNFISQINIEFPVKIVHVLLVL